MQRILISIFACVLLASCASPTTVSSDFKFDPASAQALIVGSITYENGTAAYSVEATSRDGQSRFFASVGYSAWPPLGPVFDDALKMKGGTFAVAVTPGQYTLQRWTRQRGARADGPPNPIGIPFTANAGQVTYLGNFNFDFDGDGNVSLNDRSERDLPILRSRFKAIGATPPAYAIRSGAHLQNLGKEPTSSADMALYLANPNLPPSSAASGVAGGFDPKTMATVQDTAENVENAPRGTRFFVVAEINGKGVSRDAQSASANASRGLGMNMRVVDVERPVPAQKTRLKLRGSLGFAAPIQAIFASVASGGSREVSGEVEVELRPDGRYRVAGVIDELRSEVWLEDIESHQVVRGTRIAAPPTAEAAKAAAAPLTYTCCNLHLDDERWVSDGNWIERPFIAAGTPVRVYEYRKDRAKAVIDGKVTWLGLDNGGKQQTLPQWVSRIAVKDDPSEQIRAYPAAVQAAIRAGKVSVGMTKEQAVVALGYPRADLTPSMAAPRWSYITESDAQFFLVWTADERLQAVDAPPEVRALVQTD